MFPVKILEEQPTFDKSPEQQALIYQATMATGKATLPLPVLPSGWAGEKDFKSIGKLSPTVQREIEPVGQKEIQAHFLRR